MPHIPLDAGNGGREMQEFLQSFVPNFSRGQWENGENDAATLKMPDGNFLCFTTDSFVVDPIEFPGGNIGHLAFAGTVNDLVVMGAKPLGLSCSLILEEGIDEAIVNRILESIQTLSAQYKIPIVTGDTKVMEKGSVDQIIINTSGVGVTKNILDHPLEVGDKIIVSGGIGEHGVALLSKRFDFETNITSDSKPLVEELESIQKNIKIAKDPTRGGLAASLNEIAKDQKSIFEIDESKIPMQRAVKSSGELLGIDILTLANEGKVVCFASPQKADEVLEKLKNFNPLASIIGEVTPNQQEKGKVILKTDLGSRVLTVPSGKIVPRIC